MNKKQKIVLWIAIGIFVVMGLVPPADRRLPRIGPGRPPTPIFLFELSSSRIHYGKLLIQWAMVAVVAGGLIVKFKDNKKR